MRKDFFPTRDQAVAMWTQNFVARLSAEVGHFGVPEQELADYQVLSDAFVAAYNANDPGTRSRYTVRRKADAKQGLEAEARRLSRLLQGTAGLSDAQKSLLGLSVRTGGGKQTLLHGPSSRPQLSVRSTVGRTVTLDVLDSETPGRRRPRGVIGAAVYGYWQGGDPPAALIPNWTFLGYTTTSRFTARLSQDAVPGTQVHLAAHWLGTRLEIGGTSNVVSTYVPFGGVTDFVQLGVRRAA
jgi:hypothetical protein